MKGKLVLLTLLMFIFLSFNVSSPASAANLDVQTIMNKMKEAWEPGTSCTKKVIFTLKDTQGNLTSTWAARYGRKKIADGSTRSLLIMLEPDSLKGITMLSSQKDGNYSMWSYLPALKRTLAVGGIGAYDSFQGTDFTYSDLRFTDARGANKLLGSEEHAGMKAYKVETIPEVKGYYSKIITWISTESFLPVERTYYDVAGALWKTQIFENTTVINNIPTVLQVKMVNLQTKTSTEYKVSEVCYGAPVEDKAFELKGLPDALVTPFCPLPAAK